MNRSLMLQGPSGVRTSSRTIKAGESMTHAMALQELQEFRRTSTRETDHVQGDVEMRDSGDSHGSDSNNGTGSNTTASGDDGAEDDGGGAYERGDERRSLERRAKRTRIDRFSPDDDSIRHRFTDTCPRSSSSSSPPAQEHHDAACGDVAQVSSAPMLLNDDPRCPRLLTCAGVLHDTGRGHGTTSTLQSAAGPAAGSNAQSSTAAGAANHQGRAAQGPEAPDVGLAHAILCRGATRCSMHA